MGLLNRYIFATVLSTILMVLLVICALDWLARLIDEQESIAGGYTFVETLIYSSLNIPNSIYKFMPFAALVGALIGLGGLAATSELVTMRAAGVSLWQITLAVIKPVLLFIFLSLLLAEYVIPTAEHHAENRRTQALGIVKSALSSRGGLWNREGNEYMHFNSVQVNGRLLGITRYHFDSNKQLQTATFAEAAIYVDNYWQEEGITETLITDTGIEKRTVTTRRWDTPLSPALLAILIQEADNLSMSKLYNYIAYLNQQGIDSGSYQLSFWNKVLQPLAIISLVMIAISFIFGPLREATMGYRIFSGVVVGILFQLVQKLLGPTSLVYGFPPVIAVIIPIVVCFILGGYLLAKNK